MPTTRLRFLPLLLIASLLSACAAPLLLLPSQRDLMWALLTPLVGFNPNAFNLFEQPMVKQRMTAMLGPHYEETMQLLRTADQLQRQGPLFFVISRLAQNPTVARQAGLVWNSDSDRLATVIQRSGRTDILTEMVQGAVTATVAGAAPRLPAEISKWLVGAPASGSGVAGPGALPTEIKPASQDEPALPASKEVLPPLPRPTGEGAPPVEAFPAPTENAMPVPATELQSPEGATPPVEISPPPPAAGAPVTSEAAAPAPLD